MNAQHTLGPWSVGGKYAHKSVLLNAKGESIASGGNNRSVQGWELEASLRLASAAPELLAALLPCIEHEGGQCLGDYPEKLERARAAIAKATGNAA